MIDCYILEFWCCSGDKGKFTGTQEEIYSQIENHKWPKLFSEESKIECVDILKYGFFKEFKNHPYSEKEICIDNGLYIQIRRKTKCQ